MREVGLSLTHTSDYFKINIWRTDPSKANFMLIYNFCDVKAISEARYDAVDFLRVSAIFFL